MIRIGKSPYLNCAPFFFYFSDSGCKFLVDHPRNLGVLARSGKIDAAPLSLIDSFSVEKTFEPLGNLGIAVQGEAKSVLLFSRKPLAALAQEPIAITSESSTSVELLRCILNVRYKISANFVSANSHANARLVIGDAALKLADKKLYPFQMDLGKEWWNWQKLPFVFARWMVHKTVDAAQKKQLLDELEKSIQKAMDAPEKIEKHYIERYGAEGRPETAPSALNYLKIFRYRLGKTEEKSIQLFKKLSKVF